MIMTTLEKIMGLTRVTLSETERAIRLYKGEIKGILGPGEHVLDNRRGRLTLERFSLTTPEFKSRLERALFEKLPDVAKTHLTVVQTGAENVAIIERDGAIYTVLGPDERRVFWTDAGPWAVKTYAFADGLDVEPALFRRLLKARALDQVAVVQVEDGARGMVFLNNVLDRVLTPGVYGFWKSDRVITAKTIDLKAQAMDVVGQEVLTKDRVTIRLNIVADYRVTDPVKAVTETKDFADALYRALQVAYRKTVGALTLDALLERKGEVDTAALEKVRVDMAGIGIEVREITLKDVILPGEMREILNTVVAAQKEAEANVIRRREETNATRSLANTAKVMADNPVMLRLKELEAIEAIASKVEWTCFIRVESVQVYFIIISYSIGD
ncbi:MAG: slipin family protein [Pseudomonadota bacterium]